MTAGSPSLSTSEISKTSGDPSTAVGSLTRTVAALTLMMRPTPMLLPNPTLAGVRLLSTRCTSSSLSSTRSVRVVTCTVRDLACAVTPAPHPVAHLLGRQGVGEVHSVPGDRIEVQACCGPSAPASDS